MREAATLNSKLAFKSLGELAEKTSRSFLMRRTVCGTCLLLAATHLCCDQGSDRGAAPTGVARERLGDELYELGDEGTSGDVASPETASNEEETGGAEDEETGEPVASDRDSSASPENAMFATSVPETDLPQLAPLVLRQDPSNGGGACSSSRIAATVLSEAGVVTHTSLDDLSIANVDALYGAAFYNAGLLGVGTSDSKWIAVRYNTVFGLALDQFFGDDGVVAYNASGADEVLYGVFVHSGQLYGTGYSTVNGFKQLALLRMSAATGAFDTACDGNGLKSTAFSGYDNGYGLDIAVASDTIVVVGRVWDSGFASKPALAYYDRTDCSLVDTIVLDSPAGYQSGSLSSVVFDGTSVVAVGYLATPSRGVAYAAAIKLTEDRELDTDFSTDGVALANFSGSSLDTATSVAVYNGKIIASVLLPQYDGLTLISGSFGLARWDSSNGALDTSCDGNGIKTTSFSGGKALANALAADGDGIYVVGEAVISTSPTVQDIAIARYTHTDCSLDTGFDGNGLKLVDNGNCDTGRGVFADGSGPRIVGSVSE